MAKRLAELGALQDAISNNEAAPSRLGLAGYIRGLFLDWSANPYNPLSRLTARGRLLGYFWDSGAIGLSMNFADQNFLIKDGTVQSKSFNQIVNFSRTTNATVTNSAGLITYAPHNLLAYSEQFDNSFWSKTNATITANSDTSPDGTLTADTLTATANDGLVFRSQSGDARQHTFSIWIKRKTGTGTVSLQIGAITQAVIINSTWQRFFATGTTNNFPGIKLGTTGDEVYIWGAQLEVGTSPTTYNSTTVKNLLGYSELFDNAAWTKSNSFVQTNLLTYSEAFDNAAWTISGATLGSNNAIAPNGYSTAETVTLSGADLILRTSQTATTSSVPFTQSIYVKKNNFDWVRFVVSEQANQANSVRVWFNMATGVVGSNTTTGAGYTYINSAISNVGNGWYRISVTYSTSLAVSIMLLASADADASTTRATTGSSYYIWGAQLVQGSVAGDYRRTDAAALPVYYPNHNGVVCAEKLVETTAASTTHGLSQAVTTSGSANTISVYAKAGERNWVLVGDATVASARAWFNLSTGVKGTLGVGATSSTMEAVGNGYYRCSVTLTTTAASNTFYIYSATADGAATYTGDGTSGIYIFGAQLSDSASLDPYVLNAAAAPTEAAYYGARFDYDPVTLAPKGLLIEEQRSNTLLNSKLDGTALSTQAVTVGAVPWTLSFYGTGTVAITGTYTGSLVGTGAYPTRSTLTFTPTAGVILLTVTGDVKYAQLESGSFATSFIPTAASQVTRAADVATIQGSNFYGFYNQNEGSLTARVSSLVAGNFQIDDGTANNRLTYINRLSGTGTVSSAIVNGAGVVDLSVSGWTSGINSLATGYKVDDYAGVINNGTVATDTSAGTPIVNTLRISGSTTTTANFTFKQISYYPQRLSNDVIKGLTA